MISLSYTLTPTIEDHLLTIDRFRKSILIHPLSPGSELKLRWNALFEGVWANLKLGGIPITKEELSETLTRPARHLRESQSRALAYKEAILSIRNEWTANPKPITVSVLETLADQPLRRDEADLRNLLAYLSLPKDHPIVLAGIAYAMLIATKAGQDSHGLFPRLACRLILTKYGYDCRGMVSLEPNWAQVPQNHEKAMASTTNYGQLTVWLEHFTKSARLTYETLYQTVQCASEGVATELPAAAWTLNERQRQILSALEHPTAKITNRDVHRLFHISQVTASRDLSRLTTLGFLYPHGKGRSVYYTKA